MNNLLGFQKSYLFFILVKNFSESSLSLSDYTTQMYVFLQWSFIYLFKANKLALRSIQAAFAEAASFAVEPKKKVQLCTPVIMNTISNLVLSVVHGMFHFFSLSEKESFQKNVKMDTLLLIVLLYFN